MLTQGFKNYLKSRSLGNLSINDDNSSDTIDVPMSAHPHLRAEKQNLSSINEHKLELQQKLKDFSEMTSQSLENGFYSDIPYLPECNLEGLQGLVSRETYHQQSALWELLATEQNFLKQIQFIVEFYISAFEFLCRDYFPKINASDIFSNLKEVYRVSLDFWRECMEPLVNEIVNHEQSLQSHLLKNGFTKIGIILEPYITYCTEITTCRSRIMSLEKGNELFSEYTKWAMNLQQSNRENLCDHLTKPVQRLTKYKILLQAIQKYSGSEEKPVIQEMIDAVKLFVSRVDEKVEEKILTTKIVHLSKLIDSYDVIDPMGDDILQIVNQFNKFDFTSPIMIGDRKIIRQLTHQGEMKLREGVSKTVDIKLFLLTDILLITKSKKKTLNKMKIIKPPIILDKVRIQKISHNAFVCVCLNEFNCISSLYHLSCSDSKKVEEWVQKLEESMKNYNNIKQSQSDILVSREFHNSIPEVKVVQSSPKHNHLQKHNSDLVPEVNRTESNIIRKPPVTRKQKKQITNFYDIENQTAQRKKAFSHMRKLSKSNSFQETDKQNVKDVSDNSDIDESNTVTRTSYSLHISNQCQNDVGNLGISDDFEIIDFRKYNTEPFYSKSGQMTKSFSKSLNKLDF